MIRQIVVLSGHVSSGKSTLSSHLEDHFQALVFKTRDHLKKLNPAIVSSREAMQAFGEALDRRTKGAWVVDGLSEFIRTDKRCEDKTVLIVDAVRIPQQIAGIRRAYGERVTHIHLDAPEKDLARRYAKVRHKDIKELPSYRRVLENETEANVGELGRLADIVINTHKCTDKDVMVKAASQLGLYGREPVRLVDVLVGGQYGSEGKGNISAYLAREYKLLVRVGGPNAGHKVYDEPSPVTFHHLPSGTKAAPYSRLLIGPGATVYVPDLLKEIATFGVEFGRLYIDPQVMVISEDDRKSEVGLVQGIGSTGQGVGAANSRRITGRCGDNVKLVKDIPELRPFVREACIILDEAFQNGDRVFLEGTQGAGLSLYHGYYPHVTSRDTTVSGCLAEAGISPSRTRKIIMVTRTYPIRVESPEGGTSGYMSREIDWAEIARRSGHNKKKLERNEHTSTTGRRRRVAEFDWALLRKAASLNAPTDIALTFADYIKKSNEKAHRFEQLTEDTLRFIEEIESVAGAPVSLISTSFQHRNIIDRRRW